MNLSLSLQAAIQQRLSTHFSNEVKIRFEVVSGGSINQTYHIHSSATPVFCKINSATKFPQLFLKERAGLALIEKTHVIKVPSVIDCFENEDKQVLLLEWINEGQPTAQFWKDFGQQLAALHFVSANEFGLEEDNYMGSVPQQNNYASNWIDFFSRQRLLPMIERCFSKNLLTLKHSQEFEKLLDKLPAIFYQEENPSLLHGDLWSGNFMCHQSGEPVLIDPAVYYGHRSMDMAMTTLFGGFPPLFYEAYNHHFPLPKNYKEQWQVCNLYPLLIHLYLFGNSYLPQIEKILLSYS